MSPGMLPGLGDGTVNKINKAFTHVQLTFWGESKQKQIMQSVAWFHIVINANGKIRKINRD